MFESLQHRKFLFSPVDSGAGRRISAKKQSLTPIEDVTPHIEELKKINRELRRARRAAFNLLEDAQQTELQLATDLANMRLLADLAAKLVSENQMENYFRNMLNAAIIITKADAGTIQILNNETQQLEMVASKGFEKSFINYFEAVDVAPVALNGIALRKKERAFIDFDVPPAQGSDGSLKMYVEKGFLSAQSTPLIGHSGNAIGMVTTHFKKHHRPNDRELYFIDLLVRQAADMVERKKAEEALRESEEQLRQFNVSLEQQVLERTKELRQSEHRVTELNKSLFGRNKELHSLNTELKAFTGIAANNYSETLRQLYIYLEMIVTNDARNLSNSGRANLRRAQGAIQKMKLATDDLISLSKLHEIGAKENKVDLNILIQTIVDDFMKDPDQQLIDIHCNDLPFIRGYPILLSQLFHHLIDNAIKFRKEGRDHRINITCKETVSGRDIDHEDAEKDAKYTVISVTDNGIGFRQAESEKIFDMFYRLHDKGKYKGAGTGLTLCKKIIEMHEGFITAEGTPGEGASFHCYFPVEE
jgi:signal transduction histidine kinase